MAASRAEFSRRDQKHHFALDAAVFPIAMTHFFTVSIESEGTIHSSDSRDSRERVRCRVIEPGHHRDACRVGEGDVATESCDFGSEFLGNTVPHEADHPLAARSGSAPAHRPRGIAGRGAWRDGVGACSEYERAKGTQDDGATLKGQQHD